MMSGYDQRRVLEEAFERINTPKGWLVLGGAVAVMIVLSRKKILNMGGYDQRRTLEKLINAVGEKKDDDFDIFRLFR
jgi:hypothetical protein